MHLRRIVAILAVVFILLTSCDAPTVRGQAAQSQVVAEVVPSTDPVASTWPILTLTPVPTESSVPTSTPVRTPQPTPVSSYLVGPDDTLGSVGSYFGLTPAQLVALNPGLEINPDQLFAGDVLALSVGGTSQLSRPRTTPVPLIASYVPSGGILWTFDDCEYGSQGIVSRYIQVLKAHGVGQALFFMTGQCFSSRPDLVGAIRQAGYSIGNHSYSHADLTKLVLSDLNFQIVNGPPGAKYFRPPYGARNPTVDARIAAYGYTELMWTASGGDSGTEGLKRTCSRILQDLVSTVKPNSVVLLHMFNPNSPAAVEAYLSGRGSC